MWTKWKHAIRTGFTFSVFVVLAFTIRWSTWNEAWSARSVQALQEIQRAYSIGRNDGVQSCKIQPMRATESVTFAKLQNPDN